MKLVIINADDFGVSEGANTAISELFCSGSLTSTSLMTNMESADHAASLALAHKITTGFHLCLAAGRPLLPPEKVPTLVDSNGKFWLRSKLVKRVFRGLVSIRDVEREFEAQIEKFFKYGLSADHLNTDQHIHLLPGIRELSISLSKKYGVPLRVPDEKVILNSWVPRRSFFTNKLPMKFLARRLKSLSKKEEVPTNDHLLSIFGFVKHDMSVQERYIKLLEHIPSGITEIMAHPAYYDKNLEDFWLGGAAQGMEREEEVKTLMSIEFKQALKESEVRLTTYSEIYKL